MPFDPADPKAWIGRLLPRLAERRKHIDLMWSYYRGEVDPPYGALRRELAKEFPDFVKLARNNVVGVVINALEERLAIDGFVVDDMRDADAGALWARNNMDLWAPQAHLAGTIAGESATIVWPDGPGRARMTVEDARQVICETAPANPDRVLAALKVWHDDLAEVARADVYLPSGLYSFWAEARDGAVPDGTPDRWEPHGDGFIPQPDEFRRMVPVTPLRNQPDLLGNGRSEVEGLTAIQDRIGKTMFDRLIAQEFTAFPQRFAVGVDDHDPETNETIDRFKAAIASIWTTDDPSAKFGQLPGQDLRPYLDAIEQDTVFAARISSTPPHYLDTKGQFPSGDAIRSAEAGLTSKVRRRQAAFGVGWERTMRLGLSAAGFVDKANADITVRWRDPETRTFGEQADAAMKYKAMGFPLSYIAEFLGLSDPEIARIELAAVRGDLLSAVGQLDAPVVDAVEVG